MFQSLFQSFTDSADPTQGAARVAALRERLAAQKIDGLIIPRADEHQNEYVPPGAERLAWLTGFAGSAGLAIVLADTAAIFVDGRYTIQVRDQVDVSIFTPVAIAQNSPDAWIKTHLTKDQKLGFDPWLHTPAQVAKLKKAAESVGADLVAVSPNPIDAIWTDRPGEPNGPVHLHPDGLAGETAASKLTRIATALDPETTLFVSDPHALAWAFNIRGSDVAHTPLPLGYALIPQAGQPKLFIDPHKLDDTVRTALSTLATLETPEHLTQALQDVAKAKQVLICDAATVAFALVQNFEGAEGKVQMGPDPIALMKANKNEAELSGTRAAHVRDGLAMVRFLSWFADNAPHGGLSEIKAAEALEHFRRATGMLKDVSFPTISAAGPNSAIPHYRVTEKTNRPIEPGFFLIDSGAQYEDGTTDITRTLCVGEPDAQMRDRFTRVLKGHIAIATAVFPAGTSGAQIDGFARRPLWDAGLDFDHGTGHGVGSYLSVHEGPQRISKLGHVALTPGMILSNEPGFYEAGAWGIRLENLVVVTPVTIAGGDRTMLGFETITLAPFARELIEPAMLSSAERDWLNVYHARVRAVLLPLLQGGERDWLSSATAPI